MQRTRQVACQKKDSEKRVLDPAHPLALHTVFPLTDCGSLWHPEDQSSSGVPKPGPRNLTPARQALQVLILDQ